jgi:hypothetical protein
VKPLSSVVVKRTTIVIRIGLGAVFLLSCIPKIADPAAFAQIVTGYQLDRGGMWIGVGFRPI